MPFKLILILVQLDSLWNNLVPFSLQAAYLVAISDPSSVAGKPGLVDASQFQRARHDIQKACDDLLNPASTQQHVSFQWLIANIYKSFLVKGNYSNP